ncbi:hypothetical protein BC835DRAFT_1295490, partial [Cytidiella melzeri]
SDVMQVANHYFENGIAHFTRRINKSISLGCSNGEVAPFVGHNAFLVDVKDEDGDTVDCRWTARQVLHFIQVHCMFTHLSLYIKLCATPFPPSFLCLIQSFFELLSTSFCSSNTSCTTVRCCSLSTSRLCTSLVRLRGLVLPVSYRRYAA